MKLLLYCTKGKPYLLDLRNDFQNIKFDTFYMKKSLKTGWNVLNGKIVAECDFEVEEIECYYDELYQEYCFNNDNIDELINKAQITYDEFIKYLKIYNNNSFEKVGYAIHIKNLHIFDKPKELKHYMVYDKSYDNMFGWAFEEKEKYTPLTKAPQNMMYAYDLGNDCDYILISIHPEWLCKILNGEKTIEVRKKVLQVMKNEI